MPNEASKIADLSLTEKLLGKPQTPTGWWAIGLALAFAALISLMAMWGERAGNPRAGFWADPLGAFLVIATAACGSSSGLVSGIGIFAKGERSLLLFLILPLGAFVFVFSIGELFESYSGH